MERGGGGGQKKSGRRKITQDGSREYATKVKLTRLKERTTGEY